MHREAYNKDTRTKSNMSVFMNYTMSRSNYRKPYSCDIAHHEALLKELNLNHGSSESFAGPSSEGNHVFPKYATNTSHPTERLQHHIEMGK